VRARLVAAAAMLLALAGCSGGSVVAPPSGPAASELRIGMFEYRFQLSAGVLRPGQVTVVATNTGSAPHDVELTQDGREIGLSNVLPPGGQQRFTVEVAPEGTVHLECTLTGHAAAGMHATVQVG
jgi:plastocyanin